MQVGSCHASSSNNEAVMEDETWTITFKPGKLGITVVQDVGLVKIVAEGGQGEQSGVKVGMLITKVESAAYSWDRLTAAICGSVDYQITLCTPTAEDACRLEQGKSRSVAKAVAKTFSPPPSDDSDASASASEPEGWNSDDEPPEDHVDDEQVCSRDGRVRKRIRHIGKGLDMPGHNDIVRIRYRVLTSAKDEEEGDLGNDQFEGDAAEEDIPMGCDKLPLAVEFAVRCMRIGELALVTAPEAYSVCASPLGGRSLRTGTGWMPAETSSNTDGSRRRVPRKLRFLPAASPELARMAASSEVASSATTPGHANVANSTDPLEAPAESENTRNTSSVGPPSALRFYAIVELVSIQRVIVLTEDGRVKKQVLSEGRRSRRTPRLGDVVTFSSSSPQTALAHAEINGPPLRQTVILGSTKLAESDLTHVLLSMREGEQCLARLCPEFRPPPHDSPPADSITPGDASAGERRLILTMHRWRRRDYLPVPTPGNASIDAPSGGVAAVEMGADSTAHSLRRAELCPGATRLVHSIEDGSLVLVGIAWPCNWADASEELPQERSAAERGAAEHAKLYLLSWRMGEGSVPGYLETAVGSMRVAESAAFDAPAEAVAQIPIGPGYEGQTRLKLAKIPALEPLLFSLLVGEDDCIDMDRMPSDSSTAHRQAGEDSLTVGLSESQRGVWPIPPTILPADWAEIGEPVAWQDLQILDADSALALSSTVSFRLALLAATEAPDVCTMGEGEQRAYLEKERARGNALMQMGRYFEAKVAYCSALDAVRRTPIYKALFPTEHGRIPGAYTRDPCEVECPKPLAQLDEAEVELRKANLIALHLSTALCASKCGNPAAARRHSSVVLGADPSNATALFRRGSAALAEEKIAEALADLQRAAEIQPEDPAVLEELRIAKSWYEEQREDQTGEHTRDDAAIHSSSPQHNPTLNVDGPLTRSTNGSATVDPPLLAESTLPAVEVSDSNASSNIGSLPHGLSSSSTSGIGCTSSRRSWSQCAQVLLMFLRQVPPCRHCHRPVQVRHPESIQSFAEDGNLSGEDSTNCTS